MHDKTKNLQRTMRILLVSASAEERSRLRELLVESPGEMKHEILQASHEAEALHAFEKRHPDLLLISARDVDELRVIGRRLCSSIRAREGDRHTGIICLAPSPLAVQSGDVSWIDDELSVECLEMGADDFLRRSCSPQEVRARVRTVLRLKAMTDQLRSANHRLRILSMTDELTGLANMRSFNQKFGEILSRCRKGKQAIGILMLDLDHFKSVNDTTNHLIGSFVLSEIGRIFRQDGIFEEGDVAARYGGDEFIAVCLADSAGALMAKAERVRIAVGAHAFVRESCRVHITTSVGAAWVPPGYHGSAEDLIKSADLMLYRSKRAGRDRVHGISLTGEVQVDEQKTRCVALDLSTHEEQQLEIRSKARLKPFAS